MAIDIAFHGLSLSWLKGVEIESPFERERETENKFVKVVCSVNNTVRVTNVNNISEWIITYAPLLKKKEHQN